MSYSTNSNNMYKDKKYTYSNKCVSNCPDNSTVKYPYLDSMA